MDTQPQIGWIEKWYRRILPRHGRRTLFLASLYFRTAGLDTVRLEAIAKLNRIMELSSDPSTLELPAHFHNWFWKNVPIDDVITAETYCELHTRDHLLDIGRCVESRAPRVLRYGKPGDMANDVVLLLQRLTESEQPAVMVH